jgi:hypothetical protein
MSLSMEKYELDACGLLADTVAVCMLLITLVTEMGTYLSVLSSYT